MRFALAQAVPSDAPPVAPQAATIEVRVRARFELLD
jgi:hypothetical protein